MYQRQKFQVVHFLYSANQVQTGCLHKTPGQDFKISESSFHNDNHSWHQMLNQDTKEQRLRSFVFHFVQGSRQLAAGNRQSTERNIQKQKDAL